MAEAPLLRLEGRYPVTDGPVLEFRVVHGYLFAYFARGFRYRATGAQLDPVFPAGGSSFIRVRARPTRECRVNARSAR